MLKQVGDGSRAGRLRAGEKVEEAVAGDQDGNRPAAAQVGPGQGPRSGVIDQLYAFIRHSRFTPMKQPGHVRVVSVSMECTCGARETHV